MHMAPSAADLLDKAVALLDPLGSPPLAAPAVAEAYDLLLGLLALTSTPEAEVPVQVRADALRALLLSSHLLLAMAGREAAEGSDGGASPPAIVLDDAGVLTLVRTRRRCRLLLRGLAAGIGRGRRRRRRQHWHDDVLPVPAYRVLGECCGFADDGGRLVPLDGSDGEDDGGGNVGGGEDGGIAAAWEVEEEEGTGVAEEAKEEEAILSLERGALEVEEGILLSVALPLPSPGAASGPFSTGGGGGNGKVRFAQPPAEAEAREGHLIQLLGGAEGEGTDTGRRRCRVRLSPEGLIRIDPMGGAPSSTYQLAGGIGGGGCQPVPLGDTFHFRVEGAVRLCPPPGDETKGIGGGGDGGSLTFQVDEATGGGLADGTGWVTAFDAAAEAAAEVWDAQEALRSEWAGCGEEWKECAAKRRLALSG